MSAKNTPMDDELAIGLVGELRELVSDVDFDWLRGYQCYLAACDFTGWQGERFSFDSFCQAYLRYGQLMLIPVDERRAEHREEIGRLEYLLMLL